MLLTQCLEKYWTCFHQIFIIGAFWVNNEHFEFWFKRSKFKVMVTSNMLENALFGVKCLQDTLNITGLSGLNFTKLSRLMHFGTRIKALVFGVKRSKAKVTA